MGRVSTLLMAAVIALGVAAVAAAEEPRSAGYSSAYSSASARRPDPRYRAWQLRPKRRDEPLRYLNISDYEVREIQDVAEKYIPKVLLNISPVVTGCPCEEGPQCTDQVYIVAQSSQDSRGLQLSRVRNAWVVGSVQQWFLKYEELLSRESKMNYASFERAQNELYRDFPVCVGELVPADKKTPTPQKADPKK
jgi:hypothetical protein